jgi:flagellar hook-length control protein FliK
MRSAGNFSPEWGYLAPAPSFARTMRVVLVATAIGATAGAGVVLSLVDRPSDPEKTPVAARAIVTSVRAAAVPSVAPAAPASTVVPATVTAPAKPASAPTSVAAAPPNDKPDTRASSRTMPPQPAIPRAANAAAPTAPAAAALTTSAAPLSAVNSDTPVPASAASAATTLPAAAEPSEVVEAAPADASDHIVAPEQAAPPKKAKHHASSNKNAQFPGIGSFFPGGFASHGSRSN